MKKILIATLGESPAVITEAIDCLKQRGIELSELVLLTTKDTFARDSLGLLHNHIPEFYGNSPYIADSRITEAYYDIDSREAVVDFMGHACEVLKSYRKRQYEIYVSIAGGRKTMSALMTLAVQFYGAKELFHVLVDDPELEEKGSITRLKSISDKHQILHPNPNLIRLVPIPFLGLFPWISDIVKVLKGETTEPKGIKNLLESNGLYEKGKATELGKLVLNILELVESLPDPYLVEAEINIAPHHYAKELEQIAKKLKRRFSWLCRIQSINWRQGEPKVKIKSPKYLEIYFPLIGKGGLNLALLLETTAATSGQLERAKQDVEKFLQLHV